MPQETTTITTPKQMTFTPADVENYLDSLADEEEVGLTCSGSNCLMARAAMRLFPGYYVLVYTQTLSLTPMSHYVEVLGICGQKIPLPSVLTRMYQHFDMLGGSGFDGMDRAICKAEWMSHWREAVAQSPFLQQYYGEDGRLLPREQRREESH